jgi:hypothetical protein
VAPPRSQATNEEGGEDMGSNRKQVQMERKAYFERRLKDRLSFLSEKGIESPQLDKDTIVKNLRANIEAINARLKTIARYEEKTEELAKTKAAKAAPPPRDPEIGKEKKVKETPPEEGKEKKKKKVKEVKEAEASKEKATKLDTSDPAERVAIFHTGNG